MSFGLLRIVFLPCSFHNFYELWPEKFLNKTNGITPRRWLLLCNPSLSDEIMEALGNDKWITNLEELKNLNRLRDDNGFLHNLMRIKRDNKAKFASYMEQHYNIKINPSTLFDIQVRAVVFAVDVIANLLDYDIEFMRQWENE